MDPWTSLAAPVAHRVWDRGLETWCLVGKRKRERGRGQERKGEGESPVGGFWSMSWSIDFLPPSPVTVDGGRARDDE